jgi:hypothetical protein
MRFGPHLHFHVSTLRRRACLLYSGDNEGANPANAPLQPFPISPLPNFPASFDQYGEPATEDRAKEFAEVEDEGPRIPSAQKLTRTGSKAGPRYVHPMYLLPYEIEPVKKERLFLRLGFSGCNHGD